MEKKGTLGLSGSRLASNVLPVPGGPTNTLPKVLAPRW